MMTSIIYDATRESDIDIINTEIDIISGSIYDSKHFYQSDIYIYNVSITSNQLKTSNDHGLLYFAALDSTNITNMKISFTYNATSSCSYDSTIFDHE